jgi:competence protein ComEC
MERDGAEIEAGAPAWHAARLGSCAARVFRDFAALISAELNNQAARGFVWVVVAFAAGIVMYFAWLVEPPPAVGLGVAAMGCGLWFSASRMSFGRSAAMAMGIALIAVGLGHQAAAWRTARVATPLLVRGLPATDVHGRVIAAEVRPASLRVVLEDVSIAGLDAAMTPSHVRLTLPAKSGLPPVGTQIVVRATLRPTLRPVMPDAFQFQRYLYFEGVGAAGTAYGQWQPEDSPTPASWIARAMAQLEVARRHIAERIAVAIPDRGDATVTAALLMGEQSAIPGDLQDAYRMSGLAHLLSISGVHFSLLAAVVFFVVRRGLALVPALALRIDTKKAAAWVTLAMLSIYILVSGLSVPAVRSYLMIGVVLMAVLLDRTALSLRSIGWAALVLMAIYPDAVVGASFEMSFMAVLALIAIAEQYNFRAVWRTPDGQFQILPAVGAFLAGAVVTDIAAGGSTALFAIYHFNRFPTYSMVSNLVADPITGLWIMPWALIAMLTMPLGWDQAPLKLMGAGVDVVNRLARAIAAWPGAQVHVPPMSAAALAVAALGLTFLCLWRGRLRWAGLILVIGGLAQPWLVTPPDVLVDEDAKIVAITDGHGHLLLRPGPGDHFLRDAWLERYAAASETWPAPGESVLGLRCDGDGCMLARNGKRALIAFHDAALAEDCAAVDAVIALTAAHAFCRGPDIVDRIDLRRRGAVAVWLGQDGMRARFVADGLGDRPWAPKASPRAAHAKPAAEDAAASSDSGDEGSSSGAAARPGGPAP